MVNKNYYQPFFDKDGSKLHQIGKYSCINYWNDACWHRSIPENAKGLTYIDVGCNIGHYLLRFEQRGGEATGVDFDYKGGIVSDGNNFPEMGKEYENDWYQYIKDQYNAKYQILRGGFHHDGSILPEALGSFNIVSSLNVIEYLESPRECVRALFKKATDRVIVATDIHLEGPSFDPGISPLKWVTGLDGMKGWMEWPFVFWIMTVPDDNTACRNQAFFVATNPSSTLPPVSPKRVTYDMDSTETQKWYLKTRKG